MIATRLLTKQDLIDLLDEQYPEVRPTETIACLVHVAGNYDAPGQQALIFNKELEGIK